MNLILAGSMIMARAERTEERRERSTLFHSCLVIPSHTVSSLSMGTMLRVVITYSVC